MAPLDPRLRSDLVHPDSRTFEGGVTALCERWDGAEEEDRHHDLAAILAAFASDATIGATEIARRGRLLLETARLPERLAREIARAARSWPSPLRSAVLGGLPPALRRLAYDVTADSGAPAAVPEPAPQVVLRFPAPESRADRDPARGCRTVLLLGTAHEHEDNLALLLRHGFTPYRISERERLDALLTEDVCGLVVSRGW
jgi:hypothetical protein